MKLSIVVAMGKDGSIGRAGGLPWPRLPADMKHFVAMTQGRPVVMGRRTFESVGNLPSRPGVVMSRGRLPHDQGYRPARTFAHAMIQAGFVMCGYAFGRGEVCVIGGAEVYAAALPFADDIKLTLIDATFPDADTFFPGGVPDWSVGGPWRQVEHERREADGKNAYAMEFMTLERRV